jgi:hypothetical protein
MFCATDQKKRQLSGSGSGGISASTVNNNHFIGDIEEPSSCNYILKFYTSHLCSIHQFEPKVETNSNTIYCIPSETIDEVLNEKKIQSISHDQSTETNTNDQSTTSETETETETETQTTNDQSTTETTTTETNDQSTTRETKTTTKD